jgi:prepilin-type N-terminal cleavage/methylation domain-containing protein
VTPAIRNRNRARGAFTLVEMLVALAVMVVAMAVVTSVFTVSTKTAATSSAIAEVQASLRVLSAQIEADLQACDPSKSVLVIHGREQAAALTADSLAGRQRYRVLVGDSTVPGFNNYNPRFDTAAESATWSNAPRDQYSDPRADLLMFITQRPCASKCPPTEPPPANPNNAEDQALASIARGTKLSPTLVVYGHGSFGTATRQGASWQFPAAGGTVRHIENTTAGPGNLPISVIPANQWTLVGRRTLLIDNSNLLNTVNFARPAPQGLFAFGGNGSQQPAGQNGEFTRILRCYSGDNNGHYAGDAATFPLKHYLTFLSASAADGRTLLSAYPYPVNGSTPISGLPARLPVHLQQYVGGLMYPNWSSNAEPANHHIATLLREPPPELQSNASLQALRGCAWFQVEFLLPEDPRNAVDSPIASQRNDMARWVEVPAGETFMFLPDTQENRQYILSQVDATGLVLGGSRLSSYGQVVQPAYQSPPNSMNTPGNRRVRLWPYAIRITIRAFDEKGKLAEPLVRTIVHRFD